MKSITLALASSLALAAPAIANDHHPLVQEQTFNQSFDQSTDSTSLNTSTLQYNNEPTYFSFQGYSAAVSSINFGFDSDLSRDHRAFINFQVPLKSKVQRRIEKDLLDRNFMLPLD